MIKKPQQPEFHRPFEISKLPNTGAHEKLEADEKERTGLARLLQIPALHQLKAHLVVKPWRGGGIKVSGELLADVEQVSVVSLESFAQTYQAKVERYYMRNADPERDGDNDNLDVLQGNVIDLGELVAEVLALELDPYPRKPGEIFGHLNEDETANGRAQLTDALAMNPEKTGK